EFLFFRRNFSPDRKTGGLLLRCVESGAATAPPSGNSEPMKEKISLAAARRIALAAQGFADPVPTGPVTVRHLRRVRSRTGLCQMDSVSAAVRAHYMPLYSPLRPYPLALLA